MLPELKEAISSKILQDSMRNFKARPETSVQLEVRHLRYVIFVT
jgi:hypothetical protein